MKDLRWTELAAHVVAWHNRHPLARHIGVQHVHSLGYVMLPFVDADAPAAARPLPASAPTNALTNALTDAPTDAPTTASTSAAPAGAEALLPEALAGSLRERAMARAHLQAGAAAQPDDAPPRPAAPARVRPAFDEDFMRPHAPKAVRRWAAQQAVAQTTPRGDVQVRKVLAEPGLAAADLLPRWVLTAQVEVGRTKTRVLVGPGASPAVLGRRLISPARTLALFALAGVLAGVAGWVMDQDRDQDRDQARHPARQAAPVAPASAAASSAASATTVVATTVAASTASSPVAAAAASAPAPVSLERPVDVEPRLGQVDLPSLGPRIDDRRRRAREASASAVDADPTRPRLTTATAATAAAAAVPHTGPSFAVTTRLLRTRSESDQVAAAMRELLSKQAGVPVRVEVLASGDDWRVVGWPYTDRALADKARALLASRGMKVDVVDF
jgi:hypothetical protein